MWPITIAWFRNLFINSVLFTEKNSRTCLQNTEILMPVCVICKRLDKLTLSNWIEIVLTPECSKNEQENCWQRIQRLEQLTCWLFFSFSPLGGWTFFYKTKHKLFRYQQYTTQKPTLYLDALFSLWTFCFLNVFLILGLGDNLYLNKKSSYYKKS